MRIDGITKCADATRLAFAANINAPNPPNAAALRLLKTPTMVLFLALPWHRLRSKTSREHTEYQMATKIDLRLVSRLIRLGAADAV